MLKRKTSKQILELISNKIKSTEFVNSVKKSPNSFTRNRKLPFQKLICFILNAVKKTMQIELTNFMTLFTPHKNITKSAFCQQRMNLKPEAFIDLNNTLVNEFYTDNTIELWNEYRLLSIDGSTLELPKSEEIIKNFGVNDPLSNVPIAKISTMFDLLNEIIIDSMIEPSYSSEYDMAVSHIKKLNSKDLLILDRGYVARWFFFLLNELRINYIIRLHHNFGNEIEDFWNSKETSKIIEVNKLSEKSKKSLDKKQKIFYPFKFRIIKVALDTGEIEVLATSFLDEEKFPTKIFKELYNQRWGIETNYAHLKNHIEIGNFTGYSTQVIKQNFYANAFISNIQTLISTDAQLELNSKVEHRKHDYKINRNLSLGYMKNKIIGLLLSNNSNYYDDMVRLFQIEPVPIRKNRKYPRENSIMKRKYYINQKRAW